MIRVYFWESYKRKKKDGKNEMVPRMFASQKRRISR